MEETVEVLTLLGFPPSVVCFCGVLEVTQSDMRAGVFTMDLLNSLSWVASENLHTKHIWLLNPIIEYYIHSAYKKYSPPPFMFSHTESKI